MQGPYNPGTFSNLAPAHIWSWERGQLVRGQVYRVIRPFTGSDGSNHPVGEEWRFLGEMFNKFDDELILCVQFPSGQEWKISLIWTADQQAEILNRWSNYVAKE
jgi:hypothetical protein